MRIDDLIDHWSEIKSPGVFQGYDITHIIDLSYGLDSANNRDFVILTSTTPPKLPPSSKSVHVYHTKRNDNKYIIHFQLVEKADSEVFTKLCHDMAESTRNSISESDGINELLARYIKWKKLLDRSSQGQLSEYEIKGLLGELIFMDRYLFHRYGLSSTIDAWIGPLGADRDYVFTDSWYEVKAINPGAITVLISSVDQLDTDDPGQLVLVKLEKTSNIDTNGITLHEMIAQIKKLLMEEAALINIFDSKLADLGCMDDVPREEDRYVIHEIDNYTISDSFPRIRKRDLIPGIVKLEYELSIDAIANHRIRNAE